MGLFDFFRGGARQETSGGRAERKLESLIRTATDKRAQPYDRHDALQKLIDVGTPEAAEGLLKRFGVKVDPSITDEEEKQLAYDGIIAIGMGRKGHLGEQEAREVRSSVIEYARAYCKTAENLTWALKVLRDLEADDEYEAELLALLADHDTEYTRNVEPKVNLLGAFESQRGERAREAVEAYLSDVNETVRFHAVHTLFEQGDVAAIPALVRLLTDEESVRIKNKVADGFVRLAWRVPESLRDIYRSATRDAYDYRLGSDGLVEKV